MPDQNQSSAEAPAKAPSLIENLDTTKEGIRSYLEEAAKSRKTDINSGKTMRLALVRFLLDTAKIHDPAARAAIWKQFDATPSWFGCNASQARQAFGIKSAEAEYVEELDI